MCLCPRRVRCIKRIYEVEQHIDIYRIEEGNLSVVKESMKTDCDSSRLANMSARVGFPIR